MSLETCQGMTRVQVTYNQSIIFQNNNVYFHFYRFLLFCTRLTFDLVLWPRVIYRLGIHPYEFGHMPRNIMSIGRIMYSKMPTKPKLSHFFGFGLPSIKVCLYILYIFISPSAENKKFVHLGRLVLPSRPAGYSLIKLSSDARIPVFVVSDQVRHKPAFAVTEDD